MKPLSKRIHLSPLEFGVLQTLAERPGRPVPRIELIEKVWGTGYDGGKGSRCCGAELAPEI